jgi:hypothetical protein
MFHAGYSVGRWLAALVVVLGCGALGLAAVRTWRADADVSMAQRLALRQGPRAAMPYLELAGRYRPDRAKAWRLLADLSSFAHPRTALRFAKRAVAADPADWRNWDQLGLVEYQLGEPVAAQRALAEAVARDSGWEAHYRLGSLALLLGRNQEFWAQMKAALAVVPPSQAAPVLNQAFAAGRGIEATGGERAVRKSRAAAAAAPRWLAVLPRRRAPVDAVAVNLLLDQGQPLRAATVWGKVRCASYQRAVCRATSLGLANRLVALAFRGAEARPAGKAGGRALAPGVLARTAARVWNTAVRKGWLHRSRVVVGRVNNGEFQHGWLGPAFGWAKIGPVYASRVGGMGPTGQGGAVRLDFTGYQPQSTPLLDQIVRVRPGGRYEVTFFSRRLGRGSESGVRLMVRLSPRRILLALPAKLRSHWSQNTARFRVPRGVDLIGLLFQYQRPMGQVRLHNTVLLGAVRLQPLLQ